MSPASFATDRLAQVLPTVAVSLDVAMLQLHARSIRRLGSEPHFNFARFRGIGLDLPIRIDTPANYDAFGRLIRQDPPPVTLGAVDAAVVDMAAYSGLEGPLGDFHSEQVVLGRKPTSDTVGEKGECPLNWCLNDDLRAYCPFLGLCRCGHVISSRHCSGSE